ncbi:MAG: glycosyltransferase [Nitrospiraceae bacterium]
MLREIARKIRRHIGGHKPSIHQQTVSLHPEGPPRGNVLLAYIIDPFLRTSGQPIASNHTHHWESFQIAQTFLNHGFGVDVISYMNSTFRPRKQYQFFVSARTNLEKIAGRLNPGCTIIAHLDTAHWVSNNHAAYARLLSLQERRHATVTKSLRIIESNLAIERASIATVLGNDYTIGTYKYAGKPVVRIPISTTATFEWNTGKDFERCRNNYLWFGSSGFVHKGLDLVLEAFAGLPHHNLWVCGPFDDEKDFITAYHRELFETPNIHAVGWTDVNSKEFVDIAENCLGLVYPSCAEGGGGSAITCMHAGIVPILSREASVDIDDGCGRLLRECTVREIMDTVTGLSELPAHELRGLARNSWQMAREYHTRERFAQEYDRFVSQTLIPMTAGRPS